MGGVLARVALKAAVGEGKFGSVKVFKRESQ